MENTKPIFIFCQVLSLSKQKSTKVKSVTPLKIVRLLQGELALPAPGQPPKIFSRGHPRPGQRGPRTKKQPGHKDPAASRTTQRVNRSRLTPGSGAARIHRGPAGRYREATTKTVPESGPSKAERFEALQVHRSIRHTRDRMRRCLYLRSTYPL